MLDEPYAVVIARVDAPHSTVRFTANLGKREHLHCSAVGKAMLAALPETTVHEILAVAGLPEKTTYTITEAEALHADLESVTHRGYAIDDEEDAEGVFCVGSAVLDHTARCVAAVSATGLKLDLPPWRVERLGQTVRAHAARISALLGAPSVVEAV